MDQPLADRLRPQTITDVVGQSHLLGKTGPIAMMLGAGRVRSMVFWGPPGSGKTTVARLIAHHVQAEFAELSAVTSGVAEVRKILAEARDRRANGNSTLLFIDEIHRFSKSQQDALLHAVEDGTVTLIGATTENPSFEVISPLLSRTQVYQFHPLTDAELKIILGHGLAALPNVKIDASGEAAIFGLAQGDARFALNLLELAADQGKRITKELVEIVAQQKALRYDKKGEEHYNTISAFIKSMRGSDPDATLHYLARMIEAGEEPRFIARRMVIFASEDVGNAQPTALVLATSTMQAAHLVGFPEAQLLLAQCATYLATAPKSRAVVNAIGAAMNDVRTKPIDPIPLHLRNAPTKLMKDVGYAKGYNWSGRADGRPGTDKSYLPKNLEGTVYYEPPSR